MIPPKKTKIPLNMQNNVDEKITQLYHMLYLNKERLYLILFTFM